MRRSMTSCHRGISAPARQPVRLQLSRKKRFNLQEHSRQVNGLDAVNVARPTQWGNPYSVGKHVNRGQAKKWGWKLKQLNSKCKDNAAAMRCFEFVLHDDLYAINKVKIFLRGKNLACWCKPGEPCHADVLMELANQ